MTTFPSASNHVRTRRKALASSESQPSSLDAKTQLTVRTQELTFFKSPKSSAHASGAWRHSHPPIWDFYFDISEWHILPARASTPALMLHLTNPCTKRKVLSLTKLKARYIKWNPPAIILHEKKSLKKHLGCLFYICQWLHWVKKTTKKWYHYKQWELNMGRLSFTAH